MKYSILYCMTAVILSAHGIIHATKCDELKAHEDYWDAHGGVDKDPKKGILLRDACDAENPCLQLSKHDAYSAKKGGDLDPARRAYLEEKCHPGAVKTSVVSSKIAQARAALDEHIAFWTKNGYTDSSGRHYDGDLKGKGRILLENLRVLDSSAAAEYASKMLPDRICGELAAHNDYWRKNGGVDRDVTNKGQKLLAECKRYSPAMASVLEKEMLPRG